MNYLQATCRGAFVESKSCEIRVFYTAANVYRSKPDAHNRLIIMARFAQVFEVLS